MWCMTGWGRVYRSRRGLNKCVTLCVKMFGEGEYRKTDYSVLLHRGGLL